MADGPEQKIAVESEGRHPHPMRRQLRILHVHQISDRSVAVVGDGMFTPAIYRTTITDSRQAPVRNLSAYRTSARAILQITEGQTDLRPVGLFSLGQHYAETLRLWRERFMQRRITLAHIGFDEVFARMWELYLAYAEAGFRSGYLNVYQWSFVSKASP